MKSFFDISGWTGSGKNYVAKFIAESLFRKGLQSEFVRTFISTVDFPDNNKVDIYKMNVQEIIRRAVKQCPQSLFIFDEIDKMPEGLVDAIKPFIDYHPCIKTISEQECVDFRRSIFIFLSNTGGQAINQIALEAWMEGRKRESIQYSELERLISSGAFNEIGGLHQSAVIGKHLVDRFIPFLPLERQHVSKCVIAEIAHRNSTIEITTEELNGIINELVYYPEDYQIYSTTGCKTIANKVDYLLMEKYDDEEDLP